METKPLLLMVGVYDSKADAVTDHEMPIQMLWPRAPGPMVLHAGTSHYVVTATVDSARIGGTAIEMDLTRRRWPAGPSDGADRGDHADGPRHSAGTRGLLRRRSLSAAQVPLMMTGSWELQVSIDAPDGLDNLILPLSVTG